MSTGIVTVDREIVIQLELIAPNQRPMYLSAVLDTGFNGYLTLPADALNSLQASRVGTRRAELGDGNVIELDVFLVKIQWQGAERNVLALQVDATSLVGMSLLWGSRVAFDATVNGAISIDPIPPVG